VFLFLNISKKTAYKKKGKQFILVNDKILYCIFRLPVEQFLNDNLWSFARSVVRFSRKNTLYAESNAFFASEIHVNTNTNRSFVAFFRLPGKLCVRHRVGRCVQVVYLPVRRVQEAAAGTRVRVRSGFVRRHWSILRTRILLSEGGEGGRGKGPVQGTQSRPPQSGVSSRDKL
jgi:hypothetical protein